MWRHKHGREGYRAVGGGRQGRRMPAPHRQERGQVQSPLARRWSSDAAGVSHGPPALGPLASDGLTYARARTVPLYAASSWRWPFDALKSRPPSRPNDAGPCPICCAESTDQAVNSMCTMSSASAAAWCRHACPRHRQACHLRAVTSACE